MQESRIEEKLDKILDKMFEHSVTLERHGVLHEGNAEQLRVHIARTNLLEAHMEAEHKDMKKNLEMALLPIKSVKWIAGVLLAVAAIVSAFKDILFK